MSEPKRPGQILMELITGQWLAQAVYCAATLGIADELADGPQSADELAEKVGADPRALYRVLRALASVGVFEEGADHRFSQNAVSDLLRRDHVHSMRAMSLFQTSPPHWAGWGNLLHAVRTGDSAFENTHGMGFFDYCGANKDFGEIFNDAMTSTAANWVPEVVAAYDFSDIECLADVGGSHGRVLIEILSKHPELRGILFDLPDVVAGAHGPITQAGLADRCEIIGGDFFESVPPAEVYLSKHIIHDWGDEDSVRILTNMRKHMTGAGRVLLLEMMIPSPGEPAFAKLIDLEMLHATRGGRERTEAEFAQLYRDAGFRLHQTISAGPNMFIIEGRPA